MDNPFDLIYNRLAAIEKLLADLTMSGKDICAQPEPYPEFLNITQASQYLHVAKQTVYGLTSSRRIPHFKIGKRIYFKKSELMELVFKNRVKTIEEIEVEASTWIQSRKNKARRRC